MTMLVKFTVDTGDSVLNNTFLFKHGLNYQWHCTLNGLQLGKQETTLAPMIPQFSPEEGQMKATVKLIKNKEFLSAESSVVKVKQSEEFSNLQAFETSEVVSTAIAMIVAIGSGLAAQYFTNPVFGSWRDYLNLGLWAIGVDQTKNAWQVFQNYSSWPKA